MRVLSPVSSDPPCCVVGDDIRVRFPPAAPEQARIVSLLDAWLWPGVLTLFGSLFAWPGLMVLRAGGLDGQNPAAGRLVVPDTRRRGRPR